MCESRWSRDVFILKEVLGITTEDGKDGFASGVSIIRW